MVKENSSAKDTLYKKRKKELSVPASPPKVLGLKNTTDLDMYKSIVEFEEEEATLRSADKDLILFCSCCDEFKKLAKEMVMLKTSNSPQAAAQIRAKRIRISLLFVPLKKLNRLEKIRINKARENLHKEKQQVDSCHLHLQNLLYEIHHLKKEVNKCLQFKSKAEDIDLVPVEQFYAQAPESIMKSNTIQGDKHQLELARLEWELLQRKQLSIFCCDVEAKKEKVALEINRKQSQLDNLAPMLKEVLTIATPIEETLGLTIGPPTVQLKAAQLLPHPLYFLFVQANALREAGDKSITVQIEGDEEDVVRLKQTVVDTLTQDDSDSDNQEEVVGNKRHNHRKKSHQDRLEERRKQLIMAHPLMVIVIITLKDGLTNICLEFSYLLQLRVVTVKPRVKLPPHISINSVSSVSKLLDGEHILTELFPEDYGDNSPNAANIYQLKQVGIDGFDTSQLGLAYLWAQRMAGLNFTLTSGRESAELASKRVPSILLTIPATISAIKKRLRSRIALSTQIQSLETSTLFNIPEVRTCFPQKLVAELTQWSSLTWAEYQTLCFTQHMISTYCVSQRDFFYKATLIRGNARLNIAVAIKNSYPILPPLFTLQASYENHTIDATTNDSIRDMEREVNVYFKELILKKNWADHLLTAQILRLITNFDILLEASPNQDFPRDKIFIHSNRGRNRASPFKQLQMEDGLFHFTQR